MARIVSLAIMVEVMTLRNRCDLLIDLVELVLYLVVVYGAISVGIKVVEKMVYLIGSQGLVRRSHGVSSVAVILGMGERAGRKVMTSTRWLPEGE